MFRRKFVAMSPHIYSMYGTLTETASLVIRVLLLLHRLNGDCYKRNCSLCI